MPLFAVRVPEETRRRIKEIAARKGTTVQRLVGGALDDLIAREDRKAPSLDTVLPTLRDARPALESRGVDHLYLFGSIVRGEATETSDVDVAVQFRSDVSVSLTTFAALKAALEEIVDRPVDLAERRSLRPHVRDAFEREAVRVF